MYFTAENNFLLNSIEQFQNEKKKVIFVNSLDTGILATVDIVVTFSLGIQVPYDFTFSILYRHIPL